MAATYHKDLEAWWPHLLRIWRTRRAVEGEGHKLSPAELKEVGNAVKTLSFGLTRDRALAGSRYMDNPSLLGAYLLFYWPVSYAQCRSVLSELTSRPQTVLDLGSGPGPMAFAALDSGAHVATCADRSQPALDLARELALERGDTLRTVKWTPDQAIPEGKFDLIILGHMLNELYGAVTPKAIEQRASLLEGLTKRLNPRGTLLVIEPALRETSRALLQVRDVLVSKGFSIRAPCLFRGPCPALTKESDWCHADREWTRPKTIEELAQVAGLHKESLKMSYLAIAPKDETWSGPTENNIFRIVSEPLAGKGRQRYMGCGPAGRMGLAMQEKHRGEHNEAFFRLNRGDVIRIGNTEPKGDGLGLTGDATVERIAWAGAPVKKD